MHFRMAFQPPVFFGFVGVQIVGSAQEFDNLRERPAFAEGVGSVA
jgi:hypothetical protein